MSLEIGHANESNDESPRASTAPAAPDPAELARDLEAALAARRELGPQYEHQLVQAFVEKVTQQLAAQQRERRTPAAQPPHEQRLGLAITSLALLIPLMAIVLGMGMGFAGLALVCLAVLGINLGFRYL